MELAGLVLGGIPLLLYALDNYKRCLDPGKDYLRYYSTLSAIRSHVFVQQEQLDVTLRNIGLVNPTKGELRQYLWERYPPAKCLEFMNIIENMEGTIADMMDKLDIDSTGKPRWVAGKQDRANWEWRRIRRSFGRKDRDRLIADLQYWNTGLKNIFEKAEIPSDESDPLVEKLQARFSARHCDSTRQNFQLIHETLSRRWACSCSEHKGNIRLDWHASEVSSMGDNLTLVMPAHQYDLWYYFSIGCQSVGSIAETKGRTLDLSDTDRTSTRSPSPISWPSSPSKLGKLKVLFASRKEKKRTSAQLLAIPMVSTTPPRTLHHELEIACICRYISSPTRSDSGYISCSDTEKRVHLALRTTTSPTTAVHLQNFLSPDQSPHAQAPSIPPSLHLSRKQRLSIAASVVWGLLYLCDSPWMEKDWRGKDQIRLFVAPDTASGERGTTIRQLTENPTLEYVFKSSSRQQPESIQSQDQTTSRFQSNQIRNKDLFSLGILLIELCLNTTFEQIRKDHKDSNSRYAQPQPTPPGPADARNVSPAVSNPIDDYEIANRQIDKIYLEAGDLYGYAVQRCLRCEFPGRDVTKTFSFKQFRQHFFNGVVAPVQATYMMQPGSVAMM